MDRQISLRMDEKLYTTIENRRGKIKRATFIKDILWDAFNSRDTKNRIMSLRDVTEALEKEKMETHTNNSDPYPRQNVQIMQPNFHMQMIEDFGGLKNEVVHIKDNISIALEDQRKEVKETLEEHSNNIHIEMNDAFNEQRKVMISLAEKISQIESAQANIHTSWWNRLFASIARKSI